MGRPTCRVLIVRYLSYALGGIEAYVNAMLPHLVAEGIEPTVFTAGRMTKENARLLDGLGVSWVEAGFELDAIARLPLAKRLQAKREVVRAFGRELERGSYDAVHVNTSAPGVQSDLLAEARRVGVPVRIAHGHDDLGPEGFRARMTHRIYARRIDHTATHLLACSGVAGTYLYGQRLWKRRGVMANNGIETSAFSYSSEGRQRLREQYGATDVVLGCVGRLAQQKNYAFALEVFSCVLKDRPEAQLWLAGDGPERRALEAQAEELGIAGSVVLMGQRSDVRDLLSAMDCLLQPSFHEGLPVSLVEAQATGVPCVVSSLVTNEVDIPGCPIRHLELARGAASWAKEALAQCGVRAENGSEFVRAFGFDVADSSALMAQRYRGERV